MFHRFLAFSNRILTLLLRLVTQVEKDDSDPAEKCQQAKEHESGIPVIRPNDQMYPTLIGTDRNLAKIAVRCSHQFISPNS